MKEQIDDTVFNFAAVLSRETPQRGCPEVLQAGLCLPTSFPRVILFV